VKKTIAIDRYRRDLAHTVKDAMLQYPDKCEGKGEATKYEYAQKLDAERSHVTHWAREQTKGILLKRAVMRNVMVSDDKGGATQSRVVACYNDISISWRQDQSKANQEKLFDVHFQQFNNWEGGDGMRWSEYLENEYMKETNMEYDCTTNGRKKGCIEKLITRAKTILTKNFNRRAKGDTRTKLQIGMQRTKEETINSGRRRSSQFVTARNRVSLIFNCCKFMTQLTIQCFVSVCLSFINRRALLLQSLRTLICACLERCTGASPMIVEAKKATNKKQVEEKNIIECTHDIYNIGNSYDPEANANYCAAGFDLCGVVCAIGGEKLVTKRVERKDYKKGEFFRPSSKNLLSAVFCCINGNKGCTHVVCGPYWRETADR
jgi:hypothetical protein